MFHQLVSESVIEDKVKTSLNLRQTIPTAFLSSTKPVISLQKSIRLVRHDFPVINECWIVPIYKWSIRRYIGAPFVDLHMYKKWKETWEKINSIYTHHTVVNIRNLILYFITQTFLFPEFSFKSESFFQLLNRATNFYSIISNLFWKRDAVNPTVLNLNTAVFTKNNFNCNTNSPFQDFCSTGRAIG